ncbi:MAG: NtaA/DmoA family FMN-dependent monooxygenase [Terriglobales bacterium]
MSAKPFHLGWFQTFMHNEWRTPFTAAEGTPFTGDFYVELAQALERACFDFLMLEDTLGVPRGPDGSTRRALQAGDHVPKQDPIPLAAKVGTLTRNLGIVATMSTTFYHPYHLARTASTVDSLTSGRFGWNIVTSAKDEAAHNYGMDELPPRELRYEIASEFVDLVNALLDSWEPDAIVRDVEKGVYIDPDKVHDVNWEGKHFKSRGPLHCARSPQGRPIYLQAGGSPAGKRFAAKYADAVIAVATDVAGMKEYRDDVRAQAAAAGRNPDDIKVMFLISPVLGATEEEARAKIRPLTDADIPVLLGALTDSFKRDFFAMDLDEPVPYFETRGEQGSLAAFAQWGTGRTLRECLAKRVGTRSSSLEAVGSPDQVAEIMGAAMEEVGGDGFLIPGDGGGMTQKGDALTRYRIAEICDGLVPALQRRGLTRTSYEHQLLRDNLLAF